MATGRSEQRIMAFDKTENNCHCGECRTIHEEFIEQFGRWPNMSHNGGQELKARRESNERSWELVAEMPNGDALYTRRAT